MLAKFVTFALVACSTTLCYGGAITQFQNNPGLSTGGSFTPPPGLAAVPAPANPPGNQMNDIGSLIGGANAAIFATVSVTELFKPIVADVTRQPIPPGITHFYDVTLSIKDDLIYGNPAHLISGLVVTIISPNPALSDKARFDFTFGTFKTPVASWNSSATFLNQNVLRIGGQNGGGGQLADGSTGTLTFSLQVNNVNVENFQIMITANPEPSSLVLGGLVVAGTAAFRRRKRRAARNLDTKTSVAS